VAPPNPSFHIPSGSEPQTPAPSASLVQTEEIPGNTERDSDVPEAAAEGDIQVEYCLDFAAQI
jgi:hypothetical protein